MSFWVPFLSQRHIRFCIFDSIMMIRLCSIYYMVNRWSVALTDITFWSATWVILFFMLLILHQKTWSLISKGKQSLQHKDMLFLAVIHTELAVQLINFATSVDSIKKPITIIFSDVVLMTGTVMMCPKYSKLQSCWCYLSRSYLFYP